MNQFTGIVNALGTAGISDDERDPDDRVRIPPRYLIRKLEWRSPQFTHLLRTLDRLHLSTRFTRGGEPFSWAVSLWMGRARHRRHQCQSRWYHWCCCCCRGRGRVVGHNQIQPNLVLECK